MKNGSFLALHDKYQFKYLFKYPFKYGIQLYCSAKKNHCGTKLGSNAEESDRPGIISTPFEKWLTIHEKQTAITYYDLRKELTEEELIEAEFYITFLKASDVKYSIIEYILSKIPLLKRIRFAEDKYMFCSKFYLRILQEIGRLPRDVYCAKYSVDDVPDLLDEYNLIDGGQKRENILRTD